MGSNPRESFPPDEGPTDRDVLPEGMILDPIAIVEPEKHAHENEPGLSVDPEELGRLFLRDAMQQDNMESEAPPEFGEPEELELESANRLESVDWDAKTDPDIEAPDSDLFRERTDLDLTLDAIHDGSLFDQPTEDGETRTPRIRADDVGPRREPPPRRRSRNSNRGGGGGAARARR